jgi:hypothetical protein
MQVDRVGDVVKLVVTGPEVRLLRRALERAAFIDIPANEQSEVAAFCAKALEMVPAE